MRGLQTSQRCGRHAGRHCRAAHVMHTVRALQRWRCSAGGAGAACGQQRHTTRLSCEASARCSKTSGDSALRPPLKPKKARARQQCPCYFINGGGALPSNPSMTAAAPLKSPAPTKIPRNPNESTENPMKSKSMLTKSQGPTFYRRGRRCDARTPFSNLRSLTMMVLPNPTSDDDDVSDFDLWRSQRGRR